MAVTVHAAGTTEERTALVEGLAARDRQAFGVSTTEERWASQPDGPVAESVAAKALVAARPDVAQVRRLEDSIGRELARSFSVELRRLETARERVRASVAAKPDPLTDPFEAERALFARLPQPSPQLLAAVTTALVRIVAVWKSRFGDACLLEQPQPVPPPGFDVPARKAFLIESEQERECRWRC